MKGPPSKSRWPTWKIVTVVCAILVLGVIELSLLRAFLFSRSGKGHPMQMAQANRRQIEQDRRQTLEPYPGVVVEEGGCAAKGRADLIAAASASRADPKGNHGAADGYRWVREERPGDWMEAQPVAEPPKG